MIFNATRVTLAAAILGLSAMAAPAQDFTPENPECIAPANPGGTTWSPAFVTPRPL